MNIEAPLSRYKKHNLFIMIGMLTIATIIFAYDGYLSQYEWSGRYSFYEEHVIQNDGVPSGTMNFNRYSPPFFLIGAVLVTVYFFMVRNKKVVADDTALYADGKTIEYDAIEKIDKTHFDRKGFFVITHKDPQGQSRDLKLSDRTYDNLPAVLDHVVAKIS